MFCRLHQHRECLAAWPAAAETRAACPAIGPAALRPCSWQACCSTCCQQPTHPCSQRLWKAQMQSRPSHPRSLWDRCGWSPEPCRRAHMPLSLTCSTAEALAAAAAAKMVGWSLLLSCCSSWGARAAFGSQRGCRVPTHPLGGSWTGLCVKGPALSQDYQARPAGRDL